MSVDSYVTNILSYLGVTEDTDIEVLRECCRNILLVTSEFYEGLDKKEVERTKEKWRVTA